MRLRFFLPMVLAAVVTCAHPSAAQAPASSSTQKPAAAAAAAIQGAVYDPDARVVANARVSLLSALSVIAETQTDSAGGYRFDGLASGTYTLVANAPGFTTHTSGIELGNGDSLTADLYMRLSAVQQQAVVSASLSEALAPQIGSSVSIVSEQEIHDRNDQEVYDSLRGIPGVNINQTGRQGGVTDAFIRGGNSNYNLVMVDGIPLNDFGGGTTFDFSPLPAYGVDRVEVIRGPQSALYGRNAVAGVVNVISKRGDGPPHFDFLGEAGSYDSWRLATGGAGSIHGIRWAYNVSRFETQGLNGYRSASGEAVANDNYWTLPSFVSLGFSPSSRREFNFHFFGDAANAGAPGPFGSDPDHLFPGIDPASREKQNLFGYQANYTEQFSSRFRQVATVSVATNKTWFVSPSFGNSYTTNLSIVANTRSEYTVSSKDLLVAGFEYNREEFENTYVAVYSTNPNGVPFTLPRNTIAFFAEDRWSPGARWFVNAGLRVDVINTGSLPGDGLGAFGTRPFIPANAVTQADPRISVAYLPRETTNGAFGTTRIHSSFGTGIRPPNGFELGFTDNPNLKPERNISVDAGVEQAMWSDKAALDVTYFYNRFKDQIVSTGSLPNVSSFISANIANSRAYGIESSLRIRPIRSLEISGSYTWLNTAILAVDGTNEVVQPFTVGQPLLRRPRGSGGYNITWTHHKLTLNSNAYIRGATLDTEPNLGLFACTLDLPCFFRNPGYVDANAGFVYRLSWGMEIYGRVNNFLNQKYEESFGYPALHVNFFAGLRINFSRESLRSAK